MIIKILNCMHFYRSTKSYNLGMSNFRSLEPLLRPFANFLYVFQLLLFEGLNNK